MLLLHLSHRIKDRKSYFSLMKRVKTQSTFIILSMTLLWISNVSAATIGATSCSQAHVETALNAVSTGDTVVVPAGNCSWSGSITIPAGVILQGQGIGQTVITRGDMRNAVTMSDDSRLTGFEFVSGGITAKNVDDWRIDNCKIRHTSAYGSGIIVQGSGSKHVTGLVDNCEFVNVRLISYGTDLYSDALWYQDTNLGSGSNVIYVEDCTWNNTALSSAVDGNYSGRYVARFNTLNNAYFEGHGARNSRGIQKWEIYRNTINNNYPPMTTAMNVRGGTGVIFDNSCSGSTAGCKFYFGLERAMTSYSYAGKCDGNSPWDANKLSNGYLCRDQVGAGSDTQLGPGKESQSPYAQTERPAYLWGNTYGDSAWNFYVAYGSSQQQEDRDFYVDDSSHDSIDGGGIIVGTLAQRPATCQPSEGYWATDQGSWNTQGDDGVLYKCTSTNTWEKYYEPYTYPHPLRQTEPIGKPLSPKNLRIVASQKELSLSVTTSGNGSVDVVPNQDTYSFGQQVTLTAMADPGWVFRGWSGDLAGNDNPVTLTISGDHQVTATFADSALAYSEGFEAYNDGDDPVDWLDTAANNSMSEDNSLFQVVDIGDEKVFSTASTLTNIHSHYTGSGSTVFSDYEYTGRMMMTGSSGAIGVTFLSQYPVRDAYYRLRRYSSNSFHIAPHGTSITGGTTDTGVVPPANDWYRFRIWVQDTGTRTEIRAKVWPDGGAEPANWQVDAYDDSITRLTSGTFGVWSYSSGEKYWDDLMVIPFSP